jgi:hypothetical protein
MIKSKPLSVAALIMAFSAFSQFSVSPIYLSGFSGSLTET